MGTLDASLWTGAEQKFSDLTNRVEMLETELVAMKLCKLKMEADKTQVEVHAKELEKALSALQAAANPDLAEVRASSHCPPSEHTCPGNGTANSCMCMVACRNCGNDGRIAQGDEEDVEAELGRICGSKG